MVHTNGVSLHIGAGAGKQLWQDIITAKREIKIVSPHLHASLIKELIGLNEKGIQITLITTLSGSTLGDANEYDYRDELIRQKKYPNQSGKKRKEMLKSLLTFMYVALFVFISLGAYTYFFYHLYAQVTFLLLFLTTLILIGATTAEIQNIAAYRYSYHTLFPIKVYISPHHREMLHKSRLLVHANIFLIDQEIAYIGSVNFTQDSLTSNYESLVRIIDIKALKEIDKEIDLLFHASSEELESLDVTVWGKDIYPEPL
jgi:phosphatidylserine/phosphatidylglycerophosphate/cardiolipin synthase-like enzyme